MLLDLIDSLRCPRVHEETALVCVAHRARDRELESGVLGCPSCRAEFEVRERVAWFGGAEVSGPAVIPADDALVLRLSALLDLGAPGGVVAFASGYAACAHPVADRTGVHALLVNVAMPHPPVVSAACGVRALPLAAGSLRGAVLDEANAGLLASAARAVRVGGRLVAPVAWSVPDDYRELARDGLQWVAERSAARSPPVTLRVAR